MNDSMGEYVADRVIKLMLKKGIQVIGSNILVLGFTFKENCPDVRNTKVIDIINSLKEYNLNVTTYDPFANTCTARREYGIDVVNELPLDMKYDAVIFAVAHDSIKNLDISELLKPKHVVFDVKGMRDKLGTDGRL